MAPIREFITRWGFDVDMDALDAMETRTKKIRSGFLKMGAAATAALAGIVIPAATFDDTLRQSAAAAGVSADKFEGLMGRLREQGMSVAEDLGISGQQVAAGFFDVISAGVTPAHEHFESFSNAGFRLAKIMGGDVGPAVERLKTTLNAFQMDVAEASDVSDVFVKANTLGQTSIAQLSEAMAKAGPVAFQAGKDLEETTAALIALAESGYRGAEGGEALKQIILALGAATPRAKAAMEDLGVNVVDESTGKFLSFAEIVAQFEDKLGGLTESQKIATVTQIVGREAAAKFLAVVGQGSKNIEDWEKKLNNATGTTEHYIEQLAGFWDIGRRLIQALKNLAIQIGTPLLGPLTDGAKLFLELTKNVRAFMVEHPNLTSGLSKVAGATLGIIALGSAFGALVSTITLARIAIARMGTEALLANAKAIAVPILLVAIGLLLFALFDDLAAAMAGNESFIGDLIERFREWRFEIGAAAGLIGGIALLFGAMFAPITLLIVLLGVLFTTILRNIDAYKEFWELNKGTDWGQIAGEFAGWIAQLIDWENVLQRLQKLYKWFKTEVLGIGEVTPEQIVVERLITGVGTRGMEAITTLPAIGTGIVPGLTAPMVPMAAPAAPANVTVQTGNINVEGVGRNEILETVEDQQRQQLRQLENELE